MAHLDTTRTARGLIAATGNNHRLYAPGTLRIRIGGTMDWVDQCKPHCPHGDGTCWSHRSALVPTGMIDTDGRATP